MLTALLAYYVFYKPDLKSFFFPPQPQRKIPASFTAAQKKDMEMALKTATKGASIIDKRLQFEATNRIAVKADLLDITNCIGNPPVITALYRSTLNIKNDDSNQHTLTFVGGKKITIPGNTTKEIIADFGGGRVQFNYTCDAGTQPAGIVSQQTETASPSALPR